MTYLQESVGIYAGEDKSGLIYSFYYGVMRRKIKTRNSSNGGRI